MNTSIYTGLVLQLLPQMVNIQEDALLSQKMMEGNIIDDIRFKPFNVISIQFIRTYISEEMTDLR